MTEIEFRAWPKIARLFRSMIITEKIDGTNAAVGIVELDDWHDVPPAEIGATAYRSIGPTDYAIYAQSRKRLITPGKNDNAGFAGWVDKNADALVDVLGPGLHFGEWWGLGIQRNYGLTEKRLSLFNSDRWADTDLAAVPGLGTTPVLYRGLMDTDKIHEVMVELRVNGSHAAPGFMDPEGICVYHSAGRSIFKATLENDTQPKGTPGAE